MNKMGFPPRALRSLRETFGKSGEARGVLVNNGSGKATVQVAKPGVHFQKLRDLAEIAEHAKIAEVDIDRLVMSLDSHKE